MGIMFMWVLACAWTIYSIKTILSSPKDLPAIKESDKDLVISIAMISSIALGLFHIVYALIAAGAVGNAFFTLISAVLILGWIVTILQVFVKLGQFANGQLAPSESKITWWTVLKVIHLIWFGYFILFK